VSTLTEESDAILAYTRECLARSQNVAAKPTIHVRCEPAELRLKTGHVCHMHSNARLIRAVRSAWVPIAKHRGRDLASDAIVQPITRHRPPGV
jgi:hypothetical protein